MKTFILSISKHFFKDHPRAYQSTDFKVKIMNRFKIHTIRVNPDYWINIIIQIIEGIGFLSLRQWVGEPYISKSCEFLKLTKSGYELINKKDGKWYVTRSNEEINVNVLCRNDGLSFNDFNAWFPLDHYQSLIVIHFTDFRYSNEPNEPLRSKYAKLDTNLQLDLNLFNNPEPKEELKKAWKFDREY